MARMELPCGWGLDQRHGPSSAMARHGAIHANRPSARQPLAKFNCLVVKNFTGKNTPLGEQKAGTL